MACKAEDIAGKSEVTLGKSLADGLSEHNFDCEITSCQQLKDIIQKKSVRAKLLFTVAAGLPHSGTSALLQKCLRISEKDYEPSALNIFSTAFFKDSVKSDGHLVVFNKEDENDAMLLIVLTKFLTTKQFKLSLSFNDPEALLFTDSQVNEYFYAFCMKLVKLLEEVEKPAGRNPLVAVSKSHSFINFLDINVNKAVYECLFIVGSWCKNGFLINVLDMYYYSCERLRKNLDLSDPFFEGKYGKEEVEMFKLHPAYHYFVSIIEATFANHRDERRAIIVGTHKDDFEDDEAMGSRLAELKHMISIYAQEVNISTATIPHILPISSAKDSMDHIDVLTSLISLIEESVGHNNYVLLKFMFFYSFLKGTNKMFLTPEESLEYGKKCELEENEIKDCLRILHDACFIFCINNFVILKIAEFIQGIEKLYYIRSASAPEELKHNIEYGILTQKLCDHLWEENGSDSFGLCKFYIFTLCNVGLMIELKNYKSPKEYFMPSLRINYEQPKQFNSSSTSLFITFNVSLIPFHMQCKFIKHFQSKGDNIQVVNCPSYNVLELKLQNNVGLKILFFREYLEVSIDIADGKSCSNMKTACAEVLNKIRKNVTPNLDYSFAVPCPKGAKDHFFKLEEPCIVENYRCSTCGAEVAESEWQEKTLLWMKSACNVLTLHDDDILSSTNLLKISKILISIDESEAVKIYKLFCEEIQSSTYQVEVGQMEDRLFHSLCEWKFKNKSASKLTMAKLLMEKKFSRQALKLKPSLYLQTGNTETAPTIDNSTILYLADAWKEDPSQLAELLEVQGLQIMDSKRSSTEICIELFHLWRAQHKGQDQPKLLKELFNSNEYFAMENTIP